MPQCFSAFGQGLGCRSESFINILFVAILPIQAAFGQSSAPIAEKPQQQSHNNGNGLMIVEASGVGVSVEEARRDACRNAVRQAVGAEVSSKVIIDNDQLIMDKIISRSDAFIEKGDPIPGSEVLSNGLYCLKIKAHVRLGFLSETLRNDGKADAGDSRVEFDAVSRQATFEIGRTKKVQHSNSLQRQAKAIPSHF